MNSGKDGQKDQKGKTVYNYEKFLDLWLFADPGTAEVYGKTKNREYPKLTAMFK